jgi:3-hydroxyacyl-[acyl-carrier-protein] dehydratase
MSLTPHGPGFSFLDTFATRVPEKRGHGTKWLDPAMPFFADHFPGQPLMPGVLLVECGAQAAGALWGALLGAAAPIPFVLAQVVQFKLLQPVLPGQTLAIEAALENELGSLAQFAVALTVGEREVARGRIVLGRMPEADAPRPSATERPS